MSELIKITSDRERAKSLLDMVSVRLNLIKLLRATDNKKFASKIIEEYYESILELITAIMAVDGYKTRNDAVGAHMATIDYVRKRYGKELNEEKILLIDDLRKKRNGIKYYGKNVRIEYFESNRKDVEKIIEVLVAILKKKLEYQ